MNKDSTYLVIGMTICENVKTRREELELTMFDLHADTEENAVVVITSPRFDMERRDAQWHEIEQAAKTITSEFPTLEKHS